MRTSLRDLKLENTYRNILGNIKLSFTKNISYFNIFITYSGMF
jgi:hypothetical protein